MMPIEEHMLSTIEMAKVMIDAGFTAGRGAAAAKPRLDVVARDAINAGRFPGPRYTAAGPEITTTGGLGDAAPPHIPHEGLNLGLVVSGPEHVRHTVRTLIKYGVDSIKLNLSGEEITGTKAEETPMADEEIAMAVSEARRRNKALAAHARSSESIKQCVRYGIEHIYHASFADSEALDMLEANKDKHFVAPGLAWLIGVARNAGEWGIKPGTPLTIAYERELENAVETMKEMHRRGIRVLVGGDYGFAWTPDGDERQGLRVLRRSPRHVADGGDPGRHPLRRRDHGHGQRARPRARGLPRGPAARGRRPEHGRARPPGPEPPPRDHEGRQVPQGARERGGVHAPHRLSPGAPGGADPGA